MTVTLQQLKTLRKLQETSFLRLVEVLKEGGVVDCKRSEYGLYEGLGNLIHRKNGKVWVRFDVNGLPVQPIKFFQARRKKTATVMAKVAALYRKLVGDMAGESVDWGMFKRLGAEFDEIELVEMFKHYKLIVPEDLRSPLHFYKRRQRVFREIQGSTGLKEKGRELTAEEWLKS